MELYFASLGQMSEPKKLLGQTASSHAAVWRMGSSVRLYLQGVVMSDTADERLYHETLVLPALAAARPRRVLVIGGGEGATLREVLRDPGVDAVTMVEIDAELVALAREHLAPMHNGSFADPRVRLIFMDGAKFLAESDSESFDLVIVDGIDFQAGEDFEYGQVLFAPAFYRSAHRALSRDGVLVQYASSAEELVESRLRGAGFGDARSFGVDVPSFYGDGARFVIAQKDRS